MISNMYVLFFFYQIWFVLELKLLGSCLVFLMFLVFFIFVWCLIYFVQEFFGCLVCFFTLVLFLAYFRVKSRFLGRFMVEPKISDQPNRINSVGSTRTKNIWGQRVLITCLVCHVFVKGSFS